MPCLKLLGHKHRVAGPVNGDKALRKIGAYSVLGVHVGLDIFLSLPYWIITLM